MCAAASDASSDALSRLRIQRDAAPKRGSVIGGVIRFLVIVCILAAIAVGSALLAQSRGWLPEASRLTEAIRAKPEVRIAVVSLEKGRSADALVVATGYLESRRQARIGARATGRIEQINFEEGSKVRAGEILAVLEHADLDASLAAAKAAAARAASELLEQQIIIDRNQSDFARAEKALASKSMSPAEFDAAFFERNAAIARKASLEAALQLAEARVEEASQLRQNMFVRAPFDGTVISRDAELGESIMPGGMGEASGRGSVATIADLDHLEVECDVKEDFISRVSVDQLAEVSVDAVPDQRYRGRVRKIIPMGDRARATVKVKVEILDADERLFPEMSSTVYFLPQETEASTKQQEVRIFCPTEAIESSNSEAFVWVLTENDRTQKRPVSTGDVRDNRTEILSGLQGGEKVIMNPGPELKEGMLVRTAR